MADSAESVRIPFIYGQFLIICVHYNVIGQTSFSMAVQDARHFLNGLFLELESNKLTVVATDGHRLAMSSCTTTDSIETTADNSDLDEKSEPILTPTEEVLDTSKSEDLPIKEELINEFNAEEKDSADIDDADNEFNQETEEELLDIPTFLRRQAN